MAILLNNISKSFGGEKVLDDFTIEFPDDGLVCLFGKSGSGKTTLLNIIAGLLEPDMGSITGLDDNMVSYVFQEDRLLPWLSARENVELVLDDGDEGRSLSILSKLGMESAADKRPLELSGGMKRRVAIARALAFKFDVLLLDEPLKGLDSEIKKKVISTIKEFTKDKLVVMITHDIDEALSMSDIVYVLSGPPIKIEREIRAKGEI